MIPADLARMLAAIKQALPPGRAEIGLHEPVFQGNEWTYLKQCLDEGMVSSVGDFVRKFEHGLSDFTGTEHAVAVVNGTAALHVCLRLIGTAPDEEVLVPALTFVATANAVAYCGAIPHFVDSEERTLGVDPAKLDIYLREIAHVGADGCINRRTGRRIRALIAMHTFGHPVDLDRLVEVCNRHRLDLIEDAAQSLGSWYKGRHTGNWGRLAAMSFNGNKIITTGGGGAVLTNDKSLAERARHITTTAKIAHPWAYVHDEVGFNYRLPNINAALGCAQLEQLPEFVARKRALAERYRLAFSVINGARFFAEPDFARSNYWLNAIRLDGESSGARDALLDLAHREGIRLRPVWTLLHRLPMYASSPRMSLDVAEALERSVINLPSSAWSQ